MFWNISGCREMRRILSREKAEFSRSAEATCFCSREPPNTDRFSIFFDRLRAVYSQHDGLATQVPVGPGEGLKKDCSVHCDELVSLPKTFLSHYVGSLGGHRISELDRALAIALGLDIEVLRNWINR